MLGFSSELSPLEYFTKLCMFKPSRSRIGACVFSVVYSYFVTNVWGWGLDSSRQHRKQVQGTGGLDLG